jgi:hypothetical protein
MQTREQRLVYKKRYRDKNKEKIHEYNRKTSEHRKIQDRTRALKSFGLTAEDYDILFNKQEGKCAICGKHQSELKPALCIDHNHQTNKVRGLLCGKCNRGLGYLNDSIDLLQLAINYLKINN